MLHHLFEMHYWHLSTFYFPICVILFRIEYTVRIQTQIQDRQCAQAEYTYMHLYTDLPVRKRRRYQNV